MDAQSFFRDRLSKNFLELRSRNPNYSLRAYARDLKQNPAALSQIFHGKRRVSKKFALNVGRKIGLSVADIQSLEKLFSPVHEFLTRSGASADISTGRKLLDESAYDLIADWRYYAVLSLAETTNFISDLSWIATRLSISTQAAENVVSKLVDLGLLTQKDDGTISHAGSSVCSSDGVKNMALRRRNESNLEDARASLYRDQFEQNDFSFMTMAIDPERLPGAKKMMRTFLNTLCEYLEQGNRTDVYEICMQLFPRSSAIVATPNATKQDKSIKKTNRKRAAL